MFYKWALTLIISLTATHGFALPKTPAADCKNALEKITSPEPSAEQKANSDFAQAVIKRSRELQKFAEDRLQPYPNPFLLARNQEQIDGIVARLSRRESTNGKIIKFENSKGAATDLTYGAQLNLEIRNTHTQKDLKFDKKLLELLLEDAERVIADEKASRVGLYDVAYGLRRAEEYVSRFIIYPQQKQEESKDKSEDKKDKEKKKEDKDQEKKQLQEEGGGGESNKDQKPESTKQQDAYKPHTKEMNQGKNKNKKFLWAVFYGESSYFKDHNFNIIDRHSQTPFIRANIPQYNTEVSSGHGDTKISYNTYGEKRLLLSLPHLYRPLQPQDGHSKITQDASGSYFLETNYEKVEIPLVKIGSEQMNPETREFFSRPVGFKESEWPENIQAVMKSLKQKNASQSEITKTLTDYIKTNYKYIEQTTPETDPIAALKTKGFQCDMAAYILVSILRDMFHIPSRAVGGFRAHSINEGGKKITKLLHSGPSDSSRHAWVEVLLSNDQWTTFDPTPIEKEKKDNKDPEKSEEQDSEESQSQESQDQQDQQNKKQVKPSDKDKKSTEKQKSEVERKKEIEKKSKEALEKATKEKTEVNNDQKTLEDLQKELKTGSLSLRQDQKNKNPLIDRLRRIVLRYILSPTKSKMVSRKTYEGAKAGIFNTPDIQALKDDILKILDHRTTDYVYDDITKLVYTSKTQEVNKTYFDLLYLLKQFELFTKTLDLGGGIKPPTEVVFNLKRALEIISKLNMAGSQEMAAVREFYNKLPNVTRSAIREKYNLAQVGPNAPTKAIASDLKSGKLSEFQLLALLRPYTDFIFDAEPVVDTGQIKSQEIDMRYPRGRDMVQVKNPLDIYRQDVINLKPLQSPFISFMTGDLYIFRKKKLITVPVKYGSVDEMERVTILQYDTSGSMQGDPELFQAALLAAFTDNAASDVTASGKPRHKIVLMGFDDKVHTTMLVRDQKEAREVIMNFTKKLGNSGGGTHIEGAILEGLAQIAEAQNKSSEPLKKANIIVFTDGEASVDFAAIESARRAIDTRTKIDIMFVAINGSNPELIKIAHASEKHGMNKGYYIEFDAERISEFISDSEKIHLPDKEESFFTQDTVEKLPSEFFRYLENTQVKLYDYNSHVETNSRPADFKKIHGEIEEVARENHSNEKDLVQTEIVKRVREVLYHNPAFLDKDLRESVISDLIQNYQTLTGQDLSRLGSGEATSLMHLIEEMWKGSNTYTK